MKTIGAEISKIKSRVYDKNAYELTVYESGIQLINATDVALSKTTLEYTGKAVTPDVAVTVDGSVLDKKSYKVKYLNNKDAGTAYAVVTGKGNYAGLSAEKTFIIKYAEIKKASVKGTKNNLVLTFAKRTLKEGSSYTLEYGETKNNKIEVKITGNGDFKGTVTKKVKIS